MTNCHTCVYVDRKGKLTWGKLPCNACDGHLYYQQSSATAHKFDAGKPRLDLVPTGIIQAIGIIRDYGTNKYGDPDGWREVEPHRYRAALMRHLCAYLDDPEAMDSESGHSHLWHMACNLAFLIEMEAKP